MGQLSRVLRNIAGGGLGFWCPGCREMHVVWTGEGPGPRWGWNGDAEKPAFTPSVLVRTYRYPHPYEPDSNPEHAEIRAKFEQCGVDGHEWMMNHPKWGWRCHTFVGCNGAQPGQIVFLSDCTHELAGQTVDLPDVPAMRTVEAD